MNTSLETFTPLTVPPFTISNPAASDPLADLVGAEPAPAAPAPGGIVPFAPPGDFLQQYGLRENPFADSVHPAFFFRTDGQAEAFRDMMLAVGFHASLGMVTGPSGTGKTLLTQLLLHHLDEPQNCVILVLVTPGLSMTGLLREILSELNLALPAGIARVQDLVKLLTNHIIDLHRQGRRLIMLVDEAHLLSAPCLHIVRTLSNIEVPEQKLITCLLFGESRLAQRLNHPSFDSLRNRIYLRCTLDPLTVPETVQYIKYRLMTAGRLTDLFAEETYPMLHEHSKGICRSLNKLAMLSLVEGARRGSALIDETIVASAARRA